MNAGSSIGEYRVVRLLGKGGMSEVYEVENPKTSSRHALKLFAYAGEEEGVRERFIAEGRILASLRHPRIVRVFDIGLAEDRPYFVMELVEDGQGRVRSLADVAPGTADEEEIGRWYDDIREGLAYIHAKGIVHRDLKLQNVLLGPDGHAVLTDFGIARVRAAKEGGEKIVDTVNTIVRLREGHSLVMGSVGYMAPELEMGVAASPQSDWYALGVIAYRLLTGTWCDARTDIVTTLETYDPVWRVILPKLLHSNPNGRELLSYAEEKRAGRERAESAAEEALDLALARGRRARHAARALAALALALALVGAGLGAWAVAERRAARDARSRIVLGRSPFAFDAIFKIPAEAKADSQQDAEGRTILPSRGQLALARIDLLVLTHNLFANLTSGDITVEKAIAELEALHEQFSEDHDEPFDRWPEGYLQVGDDEGAYYLLGLALERLKGLAES